MKRVNNYLTGVKHSQRFEDMVKQRLPKQVDEVTLYDFRVEWHGRGSYKDKLQIDFEYLGKQDSFTFTKQHNNSMAYDEIWNNKEVNDITYSNAVKSVVLNLLELWYDDFEHKLEQMQEEQTKQPRLKQRLTRLRLRFGRLNN